MNKYWMNIWLTNLCNYNCESRAHRSVLKTATHHTEVEELEELALVTQDCDITITGGEPSVHPDFEAICQKLKLLWPNSMLCLQTNCSRFYEAPEAYSVFDAISVSRYDSPPNDVMIDAMVEKYQSKVNVINPVHVPDVLSGKSNPCFRLHAFSYWRGLIYPCCVGPAVDGNPGIQVSGDWLDQVLQLTPNCSKCRHAE